jgi:hypothetical protein
MLVGLALFLVTLCLGVGALVAIGMILEAFGIDPAWSVAGAAIAAVVVPILLDFFGPDWSRKPVRESFDFTKLLD